VTSKSHKGITLINFQIKDPPVNTVQSFEDQRDVSEVRGSWVALEDFSLDDCQVPSFDSEHTGVVNLDLFY